MSMYVTDADGFEAAMAYDRAKGKFLADNMTADQRALCDGNEHFAFFFDGPVDEGGLVIVHIKSRESILAGKYPDSVELWFDEDGKAARGYLPCESWDPWYDKPGGINAEGWPVKQGDLHDKHASILKEISFEVFSFIAASDCQLAVVLQDVSLINVFNGWIIAMRAAQDRLDQFEADYREGKI